METANALLKLVKPREIAGNAGEEETTSMTQLEKWEVIPTSPALKVDTLPHNHNGSPTGLQDQ